MKLSNVLTVGLFMAFILTETIAKFQSSSPKINRYALKSASGSQREIFERLVQHVDPSVSSWLYGFLFKKWKKRKSTMKIQNVGSEWNLITKITNTGHSWPENLKKSRAKKKTREIK